MRPSNMQLMLADEDIVVAVTATNSIVPKTVDMTYHAGHQIFILMLRYLVMTYAVY
jgi:hypothetical protein